MMSGWKDDLIGKLGKENFARVQAAKIGIAGAGGLGSNCAAHLVRVGFRRLKLVDFDVVEASNLDRQFYFAAQVGMPKVEALEENLRRINGELEIERERVRIVAGNAAGLFTDCPVVAECLDAAEAKAMLAAALLPGTTFLVAVSGLGGIGAGDEIRTRTLGASLVVIGDLRSDVREQPALAPRVAIAAAKQADVILARILAGPPAPAR